MNKRNEYGDWQTGMDLALAVCRLLKNQGLKPRVIIEPTCGKGHFIFAALQTFDSIEEIHGIEIYKPYLDELNKNLRKYRINHPKTTNIKIHLYHHNIFDFNFDPIKQSFKKREILVLGNPPWVTNSSLSKTKSENLPAKSNFKQLRGFDALTGKSNFDIAEFICLQMISLLSNENAHLALLVKNTVIKNIVYAQKDKLFSLNEIYQYKIDAKKEFGSSVSASLIYLNFGNNKTQTCQVKDFYTLKPQQNYGWLGSHFIADIAAYKQVKPIDGKSSLEWRSGLKHDCTKVMELTAIDNKLVNGFGEEVNIEHELIYPLLKSSDICNKLISSTRKYVIVTQHSTTEDTIFLKSKYPKAYRYLTKYATLLDSRKSSIYRDRPRFCLFGIGEYSFKKYKIIVSGLYKHANFALAGPLNHKPIMVDDTCYLLGFDCYKDALLTHKILNHPDVQSFIHSLQFADDKRSINKDLLMRIDLMAATKHIGHKALNISKTELIQFTSTLKTIFSHRITA